MRFFVHIMREKQPSKTNDRVEGGMQMGGQRRTDDRCRCREVSQFTEAPPNKRGRGICIYKTALFHNKQYEYHAG